MSSYCWGDILSLGAKLCRGAIPPHPSEKNHLHPSLPSAPSRDPRLFPIGLRRATPALGLFADGGADGGVAVEQLLEGRAAQGQEHGRCLGGFFPVIVRRCQHLANNAKQLRVMKFSSSGALLWQRDLLAEFYYFDFSSVTDLGGHT